MRDYELIYIIDNDVTEEGIEELNNKFKALLEELGAEITEITKWGKRRLAYEINKKHEGFYMLYKYKAAPDVALELDRILKITDGIIRHIIVRVDE